MGQAKIVGSGAAPGVGAPDFAGDWVNELGSTMHLDIVSGEVSGSYVSTVSSTGQQIEGLIRGWVSDDLIGFVVKWPSQSITAWTGQLIDQGGDAIETLWHLVINVADADEPTGLWKSTYAGTDLFVRA